MVDVLLVTSRLWFKITMIFTCLCGIQDWILTKGEKERTLWEKVVKFE